MGPQRLGFLAPPTAVSWHLIAAQASMSDYCPVSTELLLDTGR